VIEIFHGNLSENLIGGKTKKRKEKKREIDEEKEKEKEEITSGK
jgi:hypothetical protein